MKNLPLSLLAVLTLASATPAFADEIGPGFCLDPELCSFSTTMSAPVIAEPEDEPATSDADVSLAEYLVGIFTL